MSDESLTNMTIEELAPRIKSGEISPVAVTEAVLTRVERLQPMLNGFITVMADEARQQAKEREAAIKKGGYRGPLDGVPIGIKDNIAIKGIRATVGSKAMEHNVPLEDATVVTLCKESGAIIVGKENLHEFAGGGTSENPYFGPVHNPWDLERIPGGSSGGGAANVSARMTFASLGTDIAGSVRIPASFCGLVGMKVTSGRVSGRGLLATSFNGDHVIGPMTRTVRDNALVLQAIAGNDPLDPITVPVPVPDYLAGLDQSLKGLKIGVPTNHYFDSVEPEIEASYRSAVSALVDIGSQVVDVSFETLGLGPLLGIDMGPDTTVAHEAIVKEHREDYGPEILPRVLAGQFVLARDYVKSLKVHRLIKEEYARILQDVDIIATPTMVVSPRRIGELYHGPDGMFDVTILVQNTVPSDITGLPSLSVPCGFTTQGLPNGLQLIGRPFQEAALYNIGRQYEQVSPASGMNPAIG